MNNSENYIRVGNPSIDIEDNHVFILSDQHTLGVTELALSTITITEGQVPVMRSSEGITVHLPNSLQDGIYPLEWDDTHMENFSITLITEAEDDDKIEGFNFSDDKRSLNINFVADKQLEAGDVIEIKEAFFF